MTNPLTMYVHDFTGLAFVATFITKREKLHPNTIAFACFELLEITSDETKQEQIYKWLNDFKKNLVNVTTTQSIRI